MKKTRLSITVPLILAGVLLSGCSLRGGSAAPVDDGSAPPAPVDDSGQTTDGGVRPFPSISSCGQVAPVVSSYIDGLPLEETSGVEPGSVSCAWSTPSGSVSALTDIKAFSVAINEGSVDVPTMADAEKYGFSGYFTDPRLDALGGIGIWQAPDSPVVGAGTASIIVPGVDVLIVSSLWGQDTQLNQDEAVKIALTLLDM